MDQDTNDNQNHDESGSINDGEANGMPISYSLETLPVTLETEMKQAYLDYAMSVIVLFLMCVTALNPCTAAFCTRCTSSTTPSIIPPKSARVLWVT